MVAKNQKAIQGLESYSARLRNVNVHNDDIEVMTSLGIPMDSLQMFTTNSKVFTID